MAPHTKLGRPVPDCDGTVPGTELGDLCRFAHITSTWGTNIVASGRPGRGEGRAGPHPRHSAVAGPGQSGHSCFLKAPSSLPPGVLTCRPGLKPQRELILCLTTTPEGRFNQHLGFTGEGNETQRG